MRGQERGEWIGISSSYQEVDATRNAAIHTTATASSGTGTTIAVEAIHVSGCINTIAAEKLQCVARVDVRLGSLIVAHLRLGTRTRSATR